MLEKEEYQNTLEKEYLFAEIIQIIKLYMDVINAEQLTIESYNMFIIISSLTHINRMLVLICISHEKHILKWILWKFWQISNPHKTHFMAVFFFFTLCFAKSKKKRQSIFHQTWVSCGHIFHETFHFCMGTTLFADRKFCNLGESY